MNFRISAALVTTMLFWSSAFAAIRGALHEGYDPASIAVLRFVVASAVLGIYALTTRMRLPERRDLPAILLIGSLGISAYHILLNYGGRTVDAGTCAFLISTSPVFTALIARFYLKERLRLWGWMGICVSLCGVLLTALAKNKDAGLKIEPNALLVVGAALSSAIYIVLHKPYLSRYKAAEFMTYMIWAGTLVLLGFLPHALDQVRTVSLKGTLLVVYLGVFPAAIAYVTWTFLMSKFPVSRAVSFLYLQAPLATLFGWMLLGEMPGSRAILGGVLALCGVVIVNQIGKISPSAPVTPASPAPALDPSIKLKVL